uniref:Proteasome maturation protein n=1 Tax=Trichobilharzia regenti TaxID=157069 RepID=A0AA85IV71_TRIRE|nr:unnamed protein product [Trichobilharzia regenti]
MQPMSHTGGNSKFCFTTFRMATQKELVHPEFAVRPIMYTGLGDVVGRSVWSSEEASSLCAIPGSKVADSTNFPHPVAESLAKHGKSAEKANRMQILASAQGLHAPLRLSMEQRIMRRIQPRLPGLYSHHPLAAQLDGSLDEIDISDFINPAEDSESVGMPQLMMEHKLGLL